MHLIIWLIMMGALNCLCDCVLIWSDPGELCEPLLLPCQCCSSMAKNIFAYHLGWKDKCLDILTSPDLNPQTCSASSQANEFLAKWLILSRTIECVPHCLCSSYVPLYHIKCPIKMSHCITYSTSHLYCIVLSVAWALAVTIWRV